MQQPIRIFPRYAMILTYDVRPGTQERYYRYMTKDFLPTLNRNKIYIQNAWLLVYGEAPERHMEFITEELATLRDFLRDDKWDSLEAKLRDYTQNYTRRVVRYNNSFKI